MRRRHGTGDNDDELILRALVPGSDIDRMRKTGPVRRDYPMLSSPELDRVSRLLKVATSPLVQIRSAELDLSLRR